MAFADQEGLYRRFARVWHLLALIIALAMAPYFLTGSSKSGEDLRSSDIVFGNCFFEGLTFLTAFALNFGMSVWVSFVAGVVMYRNLPLHTFGQIQSKLFPLYFMTGSLTGGVMLFVTIVQARTLPGLLKDQQMLIAAVSVVFVCHALNGVWFGPTSTSIMFEKHRMEKEEPEKVKLDENPDYRVLKKKFGQIHGISSLVNLLAMISNVYVLYWLAMTFHTSAASKIA